MFCVRIFFIGLWFRGWGWFGLLLVRGMLEFRLSLLGIFGFVFFCVYFVDLLGRDFIIFFIFGVMWG